MLLPTREVTINSSTRTAASLLLAAAAASVGIALATPATAGPNTSNTSGQPALPAVQNHESLPPGLINLFPPDPCRTACGVNPVTTAFNRFNERFNTGNTVGGNK